LNSSAGKGNRAGNEEQYTLEKLLTWKTNKMKTIYQNIYKSDKTSFKQYNFL